jgi:hypothetical protein
MTIFHNEFLTFETGEPIEIKDMRKNCTIVFIQLVYMEMLGWANHEKLYRNKVG